MSNPAKPVPVFSWTRKYNRIVNVLKNEITVTEAYDPKSGLPLPSGKPFVGIWDTGATASVINAKVVKDLNLKPSGQVICQAVGNGGKINEYLTNTYSINIVLPNKVTIMGIVASEGEIGGGDVLIGMDVITSGDLAITNSNVKTTISFRTPSINEIDFVEEVNDSKKNNYPKVGRNDPCPCKSGKKYKYCHGQ